VTLVDTVGVVSFLRRFPLTSPRGERGFWSGGVGCARHVATLGAALAGMPCRLAGGRMALWVGDAAAGVTARLGGDLWLSWSVPGLSVANRKGPGSVLGGIRTRLRHVLLW
jgi:hypothetical protein